MSDASAVVFVRVFLLKCYRPSCHCYAAEFDATFLVRNSSDTSPISSMTSCRQRMYSGVHCPLPLIVACLIALAGVLTVLPVVHSQQAHTATGDTFRGPERSNINWCSCCKQMDVTYCCKRCNMAERRQRLALIADDVCRCCISAYGSDAERCCILCDIFGATAIS
ncbi:hypothetical protein LSAT2_001213 [Lamellibrachia satsuma]|nr:hypothetical protein LSAT2_001213 [Lamellibrachia satsuma]